MTQEYKTRLFPYAIIIILLSYIFLYRSCGDDRKQEVEISIPAVVGAFKKESPTSIKYDTVFQNVIAYKDKEIRVMNPINVKLAEDYLKAKDSIVRLNLYIDAIQIRRYTKSFKNDDVDITIDAETTGTLNWIRPTYVIKEKKILAVIKNKETVFAVFGGASIGNTIDLNKVSFNLDMAFQNRKGDLFTAKYGLLDKSYQIGYLHRFLNIKK